MSNVATQWSEVPTLTGSVPPEEMGITSLCEHLLYGIPGCEYAPEVEFDRSAAFEELLTDLEEYRSLGGGTIVDTTGITLGRDVTFCSRIARHTSTNVVMATGFDNEPLSIPPHWAWVGLYYYVPSPLEQQVMGEQQVRWLRDVPGSYYPSHGATKEEMMFLFYHEMIKGMAAPGFIRTELKAGMVTAGSSRDSITWAEELSIRGAALAAKRAGLAVYTRGVEQAERQLAMIQEEGLKPERVVIGHCDGGRTSDLERDRKLAERGAYIAYDHIGWEEGSGEHGMPDERRVELVKGMIDSGYAGRIILSCSAIGYGMGTEHPGHSFGYLLKEFVPALQKAGVSEDRIEEILKDNPRRVLTRELNPQEV